MAEESARRPLGEPSFAPSPPYGRSPYSLGAERQVRFLAAAGAACGGGRMSAALTGIANRSASACTSVSGIEVANRKTHWPPFRVRVPIRRP
jgi:hypothetical protein